MKDIDWFSLMEIMHIWSLEEKEYMHLFSHADSCSFLMYFLVCASHVWQEDFCEALSGWNEGAIHQTHSSSVFSVCVPCNEAMKLC